MQQILDLEHTSHKSQLKYYYLFLCTLSESVVMLWFLKLITSLSLSLSQLAKGTNAEWKRTSVIRYLAGVPQMLVIGR